MTATRFNDKMAASVAEPKEKAPAKIYAETDKVQVKHRGHSRKSSGFGGGTDGNGTQETEKVQGKVMQHEEDTQRRSSGRTMSLS